MKLFGLHQSLPNVRRALLQNFPLNEYSDSLQLGRIISKHRLVTCGRNAGETTISQHFVAKQQDIAIDGTTQVS